MNLNSGFPMFPNLLNPGSFSVCLLPFILVFRLYRLRNLRKRPYPFAESLWLHFPRPDSLTAMIRKGRNSPITLSTAFRALKDPNEIETFWDALPN